MIHHDMPPIQIVGFFLVMFLPLLSFLLVISIGKQLKHQASHLATVFQGLGLIASLVLFLGDFGFSWLSDWFAVGSYQFSISILADGVALWMALIVNLISFLVHLFSIEYMKSDLSRYRYFALLGLFTFAMLGVVLAGNVLLVFVFWELVGLSSYLLIGFWYRKPEAAQASKKAFIMNRIGDAGFLMGIMILWAQLGNLDIAFIQQNPFIGFDIFWLTLAGIGILCGVIGKSAQFPLQTWLPDAMEGPTPVSALIHAATMVAAGVYLLVRLYPVFNTEVQQIMLLIGAITSFSAALAALAQNDIKKVLAYSTVSQLGYMLMAAGAGAFGTAFFHLSTHAFFKAGLFLAAGSVIHSLHQSFHESKVRIDAQDMRFMGGLRKQLPKTFITYTLLAASLCGLPFSSGFMSKEGILAVLWQQEGIIGNLVFSMTIFTAFITPLYIGRQWWMVFGGSSRADSGSHKIRESGKAMMIPLYILAFLSLTLWIALNPFNPSRGWLFSTVNFFEQGFLHAHFAIALTSVLLALAGLTLAFWLYGRKSFKPDQDVFQKEWLNRHFYLDLFYQKAIVEKIIHPVSDWVTRFDQKILDRLVNILGILPVIFGHIVAWADRTFIDGTINTLAWLAQYLGKTAKKWQLGSASSFIAGMVLVSILVLIWMVF